jgi:hypothetical protein
MRLSMAYLHLSLSTYESGGVSQISAVVVGYARIPFCFMACWWPALPSSPLESRQDKQDVIHPVNTDPACSTALCIATRASELPVHPLEVGNTAGTWGRQREKKKERREKQQGIEI